MESRRGGVPGFSKVGRKNRILLFRLARKHHRGEGSKRYQCLFFFGAGDWHALYLSAASACSCAICVYVIMCTGAFGGTPHLYGNQNERVNQCIMARQLSKYMNIAIEGEFDQNISKCCAFVPSCSAQIARALNVDDIIYLSLAWRRVGENFVFAARCWPWPRS